MNRKNLLLAFAATLVTLVVAEVAMRVALPLPGVSPVPADAVPGLLIPHPTRHYAYTPNFVGQLRTENYGIDIRINSLGLRDESIEPGDTVDILAVGDSYTAGYGVQAEERWSSHLEAYINSTSVLPGETTVANAAVSGYSLTQIRLLIEEVVHLNPKIVVLGLYPPANFRRLDPYVYHNGHAIVRSMTPYVKPTDDAILYSPIENRELQRIHFWCMENFHLGARTILLFHDSKERAKQTPDNNLPPGGGSVTLLDEVGMLNRMLSDRGIGLVVLVVNHQMEDGTFDARDKLLTAEIVKYCRRARITVFDPMPVLESTAASRPIYRFPNDHHWTAAAHAMVGTKLGEFMLQHQWIVDWLQRAP